MKRISLYRSLPLFIAVRGMWAAFGRHFTVLQRKKRAERRSENANKPSIHAAFRRSTDCIGHFEAGTKSYYFLYEKLREAGGEAKVLCAGALTNMAILLERYPEAGKLIKELIWCGGTQRHASLQIVKDVQTYLDPEAAQYVLEQGLNFTMCPVDAGTFCYMSLSEVDSRRYETEPVMHQFNRLLKKRWCDVNAEAPMGERKRHLPMQEMAAVAAAVLPWLCEKKKRYGEVDLKGKLTFGMLVIDINNRLEHTEEEMNISQVCHIDRERLIHLLYMDSGQE